MKRALVAILAAALVLAAMIFTLANGVHIQEDWTLLDADEAWCGDLFMAAEEAEEGFTYSCTDDYGDG